MSKYKLSHLIQDLQYTLEKEGDYPVVFIYCCECNESDVGIEEYLKDGPVIEPVKQMLSRPDGLQECLIIRL